MESTVISSPFRNQVSLRLQFGKKFLFTFSLLMMFSLTAMTQSLEEYKAQQLKEMQQFKQDENKQLDQLRQEYTDFVNKRDAEFKSYLEKEWKDFERFQGLLPPEKPKPVDIPKYKPVDNVILQITNIPISIKPSPVAPPSPIVPRPMILKPEASNFETDKINFVFYGVKINLEIDKNMEPNHQIEANTKAVASFWEDMSKTNYNFLVNQLKEAKENLNLNDYGYYLFIKKFSEQLSDTTQNAKSIMQWYLLNRSGYKAKIAFNNKLITLLLPSINTIYSTDYLTIKGIKYYIQDKQTKASYTTYEEDYDKDGAIMDYHIFHPINFGGKAAIKKLNFKYNDKDYSIPLAYDPRLIEFYKDYPQTEIGINFNSAVSVQAKESIAEQLTPLVKDMKSIDAVNFLLHLVQTAFEYKTDDEQFGKEKYDFPDEILYYPFSDCDDRAVFFSYLVRECLGLKVIGLSYPDHICTAVQMAKEDQTGDYVTVDQAQYTVADPTYINAPLGMTMPQYKNVRAEIVPNENLQNLNGQQEKFWLYAAKGGIYKGSNEKNIIIDKKGDAILTGFFNGSVNLNGKTLTGNPDLRNFFIGKFSSQGKVEWMQTLPAGKNSSGLALVNDENGNYYVTASIESLKSASSDVPLPANVVVACYSETGNPQWLKALKLDTLSSKANQAFSASLSTSGKLNDLRISQAATGFDHYGLYLSNNQIILNETVNQMVTPTKAAIAFGSTESINYIELIEKQTNDLLTQQADKGIAGLLAVVSIIQNTGVVIPGRIAQNALDKYNPNFKSSSPSIYKNIGKISFLKNANGIISIQTENGNDIKFDKVKVSDKSSARIISLPGGDFKLEVLSGIKVGRSIIWFPLNNVKLLKKSGDLLFDYSSDHSQAKVNLRKDILN
jgi:hypothetical protein